jgi:hypothetical protein
VFDSLHHSLLLHSLRCKLGRHVTPSLSENEKVPSLGKISNVPGRAFGRCFANIHGAPRVRDFRPQQLYLLPSLRVCNRPIPAHDRSHDSAGSQWYAYLFFLVLCLNIYMKLAVCHLTLSKHSPVSTLSSIFLPLAQPAHRTACAGTGLPGSTNAFVGYVVMSLIFDGFVFAATLVYSFMASKSCRPLHLLQIIWRDGALYFFVVFSGQLALVFCLQYGRVSAFLPTYSCLLTIQLPAFDQNAAWTVS